MPPIDPSAMQSTRKFDYTVGIRIKSLREERHMTQIQLALAIGISGSQLSRVENGQRSLSFQQALAIAKTFSVPLKALVTPLRDFQRVA